MGRLILVAILCLLAVASVNALDVAETRALAEEGDASAQYSLAIRYGTGDGVERDYTEAVKWTRKAADQGHASAQNSLGVLYSNGLGVAQDYSEAVKWYREAADQGDARAQFNLGNMYGGGKGVQKDMAEAYAWVSLAAGAGDQDAIKIRAMIINALSTGEFSAAKRREAEIALEIQQRKSRE